MSKSPAVFDIQTQMDEQQYKAMDFDTFYEMALPYIQRPLQKVTI